MAACQQVLPAEHTPWSQQLPPSVACSTKPLTARHPSCAAHLLVAGSVVTFAFCNCCNAAAAAHLLTCFFTVSSRRSLSDTMEAASSSRSAWLALTSLSFAISSVFCAISACSLSSCCCSVPALASAALICSSRCCRMSTLQDQERQQPSGTTYVELASCLSANNHKQVACHSSHNAAPVLSKQHQPHLPRSLT